MPAGPEAESLDERFRKARLEEAVCELLALALPGPSLFVFEDVHWLDDASADLLRALAKTVDERPCLLLVTRREEKVLRMRFGIGEKSDHTLEEVGQDFEVTRERIRQIEAKALRKLRHPSRSKKLKDYLE